MTEILWQKVIVSVDTVDTQLIDWISYLLLEQEAQGTEVNYAYGYLENHPDLFGEMPQEISDEMLKKDTEIIGYYSEEQVIDLETLDKAIKDALSEVQYSIKLESFENENWQKNWMQHYHVQRVSRFITIAPIWEEYEGSKDEKVIRLDPGLAFGTGTHPTTQLGIQGLEMYLRGGETVLDVGTGSGILAFAAVALGAEKVDGFDLDPQAVESAIQNKDFQADIDISNVNFAVNDLLVGVTQEADLIVANILPHILVNMFEDARKLLKDDGYLLLGGIIEDQATKLEASLKEHGWKVVQKNILNGWVGYVTEKERDE